MEAPTNGYIRGNMISVGSNIALGCDAGFSHLDSESNTKPAISQCQANDTHAMWSTESFNCLQGTTY